MDTEVSQSLWTEEETQETMEKVLRRAKVSRIARHLQSRLVLANFKTKRGWENLTLDTIEPRVDEDLMMRRKAASQDGSASSPSSTLDDNDSKLMRRRTSYVASSSTMYGYPEHRKKRARTAGLERGQQVIHGRDGSNNNNHNMNGNNYQSIRRHHNNGNGIHHHHQNGHTNGGSRHVSWKDSHKVTQSSPVYHNFPTYPPSYSTIALSPDQDQFSPPLQETFQHSHQQPAFHSSPPRTPPHRTIPSRVNFQDATTTNGGGISFQNPNPQVGEEGADLLLFLATSPSPAQMTKKKALNPPATPPSRSSVLPSSMLNTPGGGPQTPGNNLFNFHDFVNITPSPAQGPWTGANPSGGGRTPMALAARRRLNFDGVFPPSPLNGGMNAANLMIDGSEDVDGQNDGLHGLGMELGGELLSPTLGQQ